MSIKNKKRTQEKHDLPKKKQQRVSFYDEITSDSRLNGGIVSQKKKIGKSKIHSSLPEDGENVSLIWKKNWRYSLLSTSVSFLLIP
jgi:hypothetical protein